MYKKFRKRKKFIAGACVVALMLMLAVGIGGCSEQSAAPEGDAKAQEKGKPIELTFNHFFPETSWVNDVVMEWKKMVEEKSDNRLKVTVYSSCSLSQSGEMYDAIKTGTIDLCLDAGPYYSGRFPLSTATQLPFLGARSSQAFTYAWMDLYEEFPEFSAEYSDVHLLWLFSQGPAQLLSKTPIETIEDIKGLIVRAPGDWAPHIKALNASAVDLPASESYLALSKGTVNATIFTCESISTWKLYEVCPHATVGNFFGQWFFVAMNQEKYDSLPEDLQKVIDECSGTAGAELVAKAWDEADRAGLELAADKGVKIATLKDKEKWEEKLAPVTDSWIEEMEAKGYPAEQFVARAKELIAEYDQEIGSWQDEFDF